MTTENPSTDQPVIPNPKLIQELFDKDPLKLTRQDLDVIIGEFRAGRMAYLNPPESEAKTKSGRTAKKAVVDIDIIDLEELLGPKKA
jgi:hypothetical protein